MIGRGGEAGFCAARARRANGSPLAAKLAAMKTPLLLAAALLLTACGQSGPLKLPEPKAADSVPTPTADAEAQKPKTPPAP